MRIKIRRIWDGLGVRSSDAWFAFLVGIFGGVVGVLVDLDHLPMVWGGTGSRAFHTPLALVAGVVVFYCFARIGGLLVQDISLRKWREKNGECNN